MDPASFDEIWKVTKNGYNKAHDPHFQRFRADFLTHNPSIRFNPTGIQPGDLVGFLRREHERGAAHRSLLKDAAASVSTACAQASDGLAQLGSQASVISFEIRETTRGPRQEGAHDRLPGRRSLHPNSLGIRS